MSRTFAAVAALTFILTTAASAQMLKTADTPKGKTFVDAKGMTVVVRDDGKKMWAYKGKPLYTFKKDAAPGDINGDGFLNGAWHLATP
jgi:predicted lipoprotein with Yx(FWY)xxD motif